MFLVELVIAINQVAVRAIERSASRLRVIQLERRLLALEDVRPASSLAEAGKSGRPGIEVLISSMDIQETAWRELEVRYLDGHVAVFEETDSAWRALRTSVAAACAVEAAARRPGRGRRPGSSPKATVAFRAKTSARAAQIAEAARANALALLGDTSGAVASARGRLRIFATLP